MSDQLNSGSENAKETCPVFTGLVKNRLYMSFEDPCTVRRTDEFILSEFRRIRDEIHTDFLKFYNEYLR